MPTEIFHNSKTTVVTCIMVFTAHCPHPKGKKTWFGYWRDDGFIKKKHPGRHDGNGTWPAIREHWVNAFHNREVGKFSVMRAVGASDEWCAEAYLESDYSSVREADLQKKAREYLIARTTFLGGGEQ